MIIKKTRQLTCKFGAAPARLTAVILATAWLAVAGCADSERAARSLRVTTIDAVERAQHAIGDGRYKEAATQFQAAADASNELIRDYGSTKTAEQWVDERGWRGVSELQKAAQSAGKLRDLSGHWIVMKHDQEGTAFIELANSKLTIEAKTLKGTWAGRIEIDRAGGITWESNREDGPQALDVSAGESEGLLRLHFDGEGYWALKEISEERHRKEIRTLEAEAIITHLASSLDMYYLDTGAIPETLQGLLHNRKHRSEWNGPYVSEADLIDPWGNRVVYRAPGTEGRKYDLLSMGADGEPGGKGPNEDVRSWD